MVWLRTLLFRRAFPCVGAPPARALLAALFFLLAAGPVPAAEGEAGPPALPAAIVPYYVAEAGVTRGPLSLDVLLAEIGDGTVLPWTLIWKPGLSGWIRAGALQELRDALAEATPRPPPPPPQPPPVPPDLPAEEIYFIAVGAAVQGPLSEDEIAAAIAEGSVTRATLVWQPGTAAWVAAWEVPALRALFAAKPPEVPLTDAMRELMIGTWEFESELGAGMVASTTIEYRPDLTFSGFVTVTTQDDGPTTHAVSGGWSVTGATGERFALTLIPADGKPGTVQLRVVDRDNLVNETDGGTARRVTGTQ